MRIGTISLNINTPDFNYGARLHSWAFQQYLLKQDFIEKTEIIDYTMPILENTHRRMPLIDSIFHCRIKTAFKQIVTFSAYKERLQKFDSFISKHLIVSMQKYTQGSLDSAVLPYDAVICESDVIWSPGFCGGHFDKSFFLASKSMSKMKRVAYAPSMANGDLNSEQEIEFRGLLRYVDYISCRESYEKEIIGKYTDKPVTHVIDPVMRLSEKDYLPITAERLVSEKYILLYLPVDDNKKLRINALEYARKNCLDIVEISTKLKSVNKKNYKCFPAAGVDEFLSAIRNAECIFTNSFHAICFSVIFQKEFYAFSRRYAGKVQDICKILGLEERYFASDEFCEKSAINFPEVHSKLLELKEQSEEWIIKSLRGG